jgi:hypothetical protein
MPKRMNPDPDPEQLFRIRIHDTADDSQQAAIMGRPWLLTLFLHPKKWGENQPPIFCQSKHREERPVSIL